MSSKIQNTIMSLKRNLMFINDGTRIKEKKSN